MNAWTHYVKEIEVSCNSTDLISNIRVA